MKSRYRIFIVLGLSLLFVYGISRFNPGRALELLGRANPWLIALAFIVNIFGLAVWSVKWQIITKELKEGLSFGRSFLITMAGLFVSTATPGANVGGEPYRAYHLAKVLDIKKSRAMATVIVDKLGNYIAFFTYLFLSLIFFVRPSGLILKIFMLLIFVVITITISTRNVDLLIEKVISVLIMLPKFKRFSRVELEEYLTNRIDLFKNSLTKLTKNKRDMAVNLLLSYILWLTSFLRTYFVFMAIGATIGLPQVIAASSLGVAIGMLSFLPGGVGVTEATMAALFKRYGVDLATAVAGVILSRAIYYFQALGLGYICALILERKVS